MQSKIDALIQSEVSNGRLTSTQADELKNVFSNAFATGGPGGPGGPGGGPGGPGGPQGAGTSDGDTDTDSSTTSSTDSDIQQLLKDFLKLLQDSQGTSSGYNASGQNTNVISALLLDYQS